MMRLSREIWPGLLAGALITLPMMALFYLAEQAAGLPFPPFDLFDWLARNLPGDVITRGIETMVSLIEDQNLGETSSTAKRLETLSALALFFGISVIAGATIYLALAWLQTRVNLSAQPDDILRYAPGALAGLLIGLPVILISRKVNVVAETPSGISAIWLALMFGVWGAGIAWVFFRLWWPVPAEAVSFGADPTVAMPVHAVPAQSIPVQVSAKQINRRQFLIRAGGAAALFTVIGAGLGRYLEMREADNYRKLVARRREQADAIADELPNAGDPVVPAPGTRPELTPLADHYRIDISLRPPEIEADSWRLNISGLVDTPLALTLNDLRDNYAPLEQYITLSCISNSVGGDLIGTTRWTGARLADVLADAGLQPGARFAIIRSADGFHETLDLSLLDQDDRIMLCYDWDGIPLLTEHGFPLRVYIPDRFGMKQPKWITDMVITDTYEEGYWVRRGWDEIAQMRATAVVDVAAIDSAFERAGQTLVPVGGIAHAGARGISKVELKVDDGEWVETELRAPISETTWVIWRYDWPFEEGEHVLTVRCTEADGTPQIQAEAGSHPSGATGYDWMLVKP